MTSTTTINKRPTRVDIQKTAGDDVVLRAAVSVVDGTTSVPLDWAGEPGTTVTAALYTSNVVDFRRVPGEVASQQWVPDMTQAGVATFLLDKAKTAELGPGYFIFWMSITRNGMTHTFCNGELELYHPGDLQ